MAIFPAYDAFSSRYHAANAQVLYTTLPSDLLTPVAALLKLRTESPYHFLLESVEGGKTRGRYSIIGLDPDIIWRCVGDKAALNRTPEQCDAFIPSDAPPFDSLRRLIAESFIALPDGLPPMASGLFGYLGYDMVRLMEHLPMPDAKQDPIGIPDSVLIRPRMVVIFDGVKDEALLVAPVFPSALSAEESYRKAEARIEDVRRKLCAPLPLSAGPLAEAVQPVTLTEHIGFDHYSRMIARAKTYIADGDIFQIVPSRRFSADFPLDPLAFYRSLRHLNPSPYLFYLHLSDMAITGSSPEILITLKDGTVSLRPLAGTRKRGADKAEDARLAADLLADPKERAEHLMLLDLGRNDVGRVCRPGTVHVTEQMVIEYYSHVMHIVSEVQGTVREGLDALDVLMAGFPAGTVSGAPKIRAMEIIDELETEKRGFYSGCVGYITAGGDMDNCIMLRTALIKDKVLYLQAGGGVVADSNAADEFTETTNKAAALKKAAEQAWKFV